MSKSLKLVSCFVSLLVEINRKKIHPAVAIGDEVDAVIRSPHRADILCRIVGQVLRRAGLEIVDPNVIRHSAAVMFPGAELAEDRG